MKYFVKIIVFCFFFFLFDYLFSVLILNGLNKYYGIGTESEILISGTSASIQGFDNNLVELKTHKEVSNYSRAGASIYERYLMLNHFFRNTKFNGVVLYEISPMMFSNKKITDNSYKLFYPFMDDENINEYIASEANIIDYIIKRIIRTTRFEDEQLLVHSIRGYLNNQKNIKNLNIDINKFKNVDGKIGTESIIIDKNKKDELLKSFDLIRSNYGYVFLVNMPLTKLKTEQYITKDYNDYLLFFKNISDSLSYVELIDFNIDHFVNNDFFSDLVHLNTKGQKIFSAAISDSLINSRFYSNINDTE